jgi:hypothetical protein
LVEPAGPNNVLDVRLDGKSPLNLKNMSICGTGIFSLPIAPSLAPKNAAPKTTNSSQKPANQWAMFPKETVTLNPPNHALKLAPFHADPNPEPSVKIVKTFELFAKPLMREI